MPGQLSSARRELEAFDGASVGRGSKSSDRRGGSAGFGFHVST